MKTVKRPNPPAKGWMTLDVHRYSNNGVEIRLFNTKGTIRATIPMPLETARELAQAILEETKENP